jgi:uncharacterized protein YjcR
MDLTLLNPNTLRELLKLSEEKLALQKKVEAIDARISALGSGKAPAKTAAPAASAAPAKRRGRPAGSKNAAPKAPKAEGGKRGALKSRILKFLSQAGPEGASVKDISAKLGVKNQNVHVWFSTTGKKLPEIKKVGEARYAFAG